MLEGVDVDGIELPGQGWQGGEVGFADGGGRGSERVGGDESRRCGLRVRLGRVQGREDLGRQALMLRVPRVEQGASRGLEQVRGRFRFVAPVGRCSRKSGFDGSFPVLCAVEGDL